MIQVKEITKFFGKKPVVQDVSVDIVSGKITSFMQILVKYYSIRQMYVAGNQMISLNVYRF